MALLNTWIIHLPSIIATLILVIAALLKAGKEKGSIPIAFGAVGLLIQSITSPIFFQIILPRIAHNGPGNIYIACSIITTLLWAGCLILIAIGTFIRKPASR